MIGQTLNNRYHVTALIGEGAMGEVYRATDTQTGVEVAVKLLTQKLALEPDMVERFRREAEALRQLRHSNIVAFVDVFAIGGQQAIAMEYVTGGSLHQLIKKGPLPVDRVLRIALELCDALTRAHHLHIIHRDLKPENVLLADDGTPKLTDFGVARLVSETTRLTGTGTQMGTPYYMSPEAWEGRELDEQADIWSLGVVLFEMLTGQVPFPGNTLVAVMNKVLTTPPPDIKKLRAETPPALVKIIQRMLTRDKARRYPFMREVASDLERVARGETPDQTVRKPAPPAPGVPRWVLGAGSLAAAALVVVCLLSIGGVWWFNRSPAVHQPTLGAVSLAASPTQALGRLPGSSTPIAPPNSPAETSAPLPPDLTTVAPGATSAAPGDTPMPAAGLPAASPITAANAASLIQISFSKASPADLALQPDGKTLVVASNFSVAAFDLSNLDQPLYQLQGPQDVTRMALSPDGRLLALGGYDGSITLLDLSRNGVKAADLTGHTAAIAGLAFSPDSTLLASAGGQDKSVRLWDVKSGKELFMSADAQGEVGSVAFSPDGATLASGSADQKIRLWDVKTAKMKLALDAQNGNVGNVDSLVFSPDGKLLVSAGQYDPAIHLWDTQSWKAAALLHGSNMGGSSYGFDSVAFNRSGTLLAAGGHDATVRLWDMDPASSTYDKEMAVLQRHSDEVSSVLFTPDGATLISGSGRDGTVRLWRAGVVASASVSTSTAPAGAPTALSGAPTVAAITAANAASLGEALFTKLSGSPADMALSPDGQTLVVASDFSLAVYDFGSYDKPRYMLPGSVGASRIALSPDGRLLATAESGGSIILWDLSRGGVQLAELKGHTETAAGLAFSPDGSLLASAGGGDKTMYLWDVKNARELFVDTRAQANVGSVAFSPDGATLAVGYGDNKIRLWDVKTTTMKLELDAQSGNVGNVDSLAFSPDGKLLVSAGQYDPVIHVWDTQTWESAFVLHASSPVDNSSGYYSAAFNLAGTLLAIGGGDGSVRVRDMDTASPNFGKELVVLQRHSDWVNCVLFTPDGGTLISGSARDGTIRAWQVGAGK